MTTEIQNLRAALAEKIREASEERRLKEAARAEVDRLRAALFKMAEAVRSLSSGRVIY